jgi:hypothetical protein
VVSLVEALLELFVTEKEQDDIKATMVNGNKILVIRFIS